MTKAISIPLPGAPGRLLYLPNDPGEAITPGNLMFVGWLRARHLDPAGDVVAVHDLGSGLVTDAGVAALVDDWFDGSADITTFNYHDSGTGTTAAAVGNTDLETPAGPSTRATGTKSQPSANQLRSVATITYTSTLSITEWGLFNQSARGAGSVMWDHRVFSAISVTDGDAVEFTYTLTVNSGG